MKPQHEPFALMHYLAVRSAMDHLRPDRVLVHCGELPFGVYWDLIRPEIELVRVQPVEEVTRATSQDPYVERNRYAHHADVIRLDALIEWGGVYLDMDTATLHPFPDSWWDESFVIAAEALADEQSIDMPPHELGQGDGLSLLNAVMMSEPHAPFAVRWRDEMLESIGSSWTDHSCLLAGRLAQDAPKALCVLAPRTFAAFRPTIAGLRSLLEDRETSAVDFPISEEHGPFVAHLCAHLWWDESRVDFLELSGSRLDERWYRNSTSFYATATKHYVPAVFSS